jgi:hypothetical protein
VPPIVLEAEPFDFVFFLGVLYHSIHHLQLPVGRVDALRDDRRSPTRSLLRLRWQLESGKAKAVSSLQAVRLELA